MNPIDGKFFKDKGYEETSPGVWERPRPLAIDAALPANQRVKVNAAPVRKAGMNKTEGAYADRLATLKMIGEIHDYRYEAVKLRLADNTFFTADFLVISKDLRLELHEIKTTWSRGQAGIREDAWVKLKVAAEQYPRFSSIDSLMFGM